MAIDPISSVTSAASQATARKVGNDGDQDDTAKRTAAASRGATATRDNDQDDKNVKKVAETQKTENTSEVKKTIDKLVQTKVPF